MVVFLLPASLPFIHSINSDSFREKVRIEVFEVILKITLNPSQLLNVSIDKAWNSIVKLRMFQRCKAVVVVHLHSTVSPAHIVLYVPNP